MPRKAMLVLLLLPPEREQLSNKGLELSTHQFRSDENPPLTSLFEALPGYTDEEVDNGFAELAALKKELQERAERDPVVSADPNAPLYVGWLNTV